MIIEKYNVFLNEQGIVKLVKESEVGSYDLEFVKTPKSITQLMNKVFNFGSLAEEYVYLIALNTQCRPIAFFEVSHGTGNASMLSCREIFMRALLCGAQSIIVVHNHPSGVITPSKEDISVTKQISKASKILGIGLLDHIIIGRNNCYSFMENGEL